jgi:hypothetical protein
MTGYTYNLVDKKQTFPQFALECARAFGALIDMKEEPLGAEIPEQFEPSDYHATHLAEAQAELARLEAMSPTEAHAFGWALKDETVQECAKDVRERMADDALMLGVLEQAKAWEPPTSEHEGLKRFMIEQITGSLHGDYYAIGLEAAKAKPPADYYAEALERARWDVQYHEEAIEKERARVGERNDWLRQLRASLDKG